MNTAPQSDDLTAQPQPLPELSDARVDSIESALFGDIARERTVHRRRRTRVWGTTGAAAAVIVVAAVIAPSVVGVIGATSADQAAVAPSAPLVESTSGDAADSVAPDAGALDQGLSTDGGRAADTAPKADASVAGRDVITTASATVVVDDIDAAIRLIGDAALSRDGYVESMSIGQSGPVLPIDPMIYDSTMPYPVSPDGAWITVRVPAAGLQSLVDQLSGLGEVTASSVNRQDVTQITLDLQARVDAAQTSVDRLTALLSQAANLSDLIAAEAALAERQATLESYQQQLEYYDEQVAMSTLTVTLSEPVETVEANPAGFGDGLAAGWNGLVATLNGIVIALGFLIPWIAVLGVIALLAWGIVTLVRRRKNRGAPTVGGGSA